MGSSPTANKLPPGTRVRFTRVVDRWPDFMVQPGATGTVVPHNSASTLAVRLDYDEPAAAQWNNCVEWYGWLHDSPLLDLEVLP